MLVKKEDGYPLLIAVLTFLSIFFYKVSEYDDTKAPCQYVVKHINKSDKNTYDFFM